LPTVDLVSIDPDLEVVEIERILWVTVRCLVGAGSWPRVLLEGIWARRVETTSGRLVVMPAQDAEWVLSRLGEGDDRILRVRRALAWHGRPKPVVTPEVQRELANMPKPASRAVDVQVERWRTYRALAELVARQTNADPADVRRLEAYHRRFGPDVEAGRFLDPLRAR
jgi:hypothetical protein